MKTSIETFVEAFDEFWLSENQLYDWWAKSNGISVYSLNTLYGLWLNPEGCTQTMLCEYYQMPKQTVHSILKQWKRDGLVEFLPVKNDRRSKLVRFTQSGWAYASQIVPRIRACERRAISRLTSTQRETFSTVSKLLMAYLKEAFEEELHA